MAAGRRQRAAGAILAAVVAAMLLGILAPLSHADTNNAAVANYGGCLQAQKSGDLLLLFDESGSLKTTDPTKARVEAATYFIGQLGEFADRTKVDLQVSVAGFSDDFHSVLNWTRLDDAGVTTMTSAIKKFEDRTNGPQTDYWNGLNGARSELAKRRTQQDPDRCQAVVLFTDGQFNVYLTKAEYAANKPAQTKVYAPGLDMGDEKDAKRARDLALKNLCQSKGLADQLRVGKVTLFAIGLTSTEAPPPAFDTMRDIATGSNDCGSVHDPVPGAFIPASNIDSLLFAFDQLRPVPPVETTKNVCQNDIEKCRSQGHSFVLDESITTVHILATSDVVDPAKVKVYLVPPGRRPVELKRESGATPQRTSRWDWRSDRTLTVDLVKSSAIAQGWRGKWTLVFVVDANAPGGQSTASISISGNLQPAWPAHATTKLHTGDRLTGLRFGLVDDAGKDFNSARLLGTGTFTAELVGPDGKPSVVTPGLNARKVSGTPQTMDLTNVPTGAATLKLTLALTTAGLDDGTPGTVLTPAVVNIPVEILPPLGTPRPGDLINFGSIEGAADRTATLDIEGPGCVWLPADAVPDVQAAPDDLGQVGITATNTTSANCLQIEDGQHAAMSFHLTTERGGNGTYAGKLPLTIAPLEALDKTTVVQVPFTADLHTPIKALNFALALIAALLLGPGIPLLLLGLFKRLTAKIPGRALVAQEIPVRVENDQVIRDGQPLELRDNDFTQMVPLKQSGSRSTDVAGLTLRTRTGWSPFGAGFVEVEAPGQVGLSSEDPHPHGSQRSARLPLAVHNTWVATRALDAAPGSATLVILSGIDPSGDGRQRLVDDIRTRLPKLMGELGDTGSAGPGAPDPFGGPTTAQPYVDPFADTAAGGWVDPFDPSQFASGPPAAATIQRPSADDSAPPAPPAQPDAADEAGSATVIRPPAGQPDRPSPAPSQPAPEPDGDAQPWSFDSAFDDNSGRS